MAEPVAADLVTDAVEAALDAALPVPVGDGAAPDGAVPPYLVVSYLGGSDAPLDLGGGWVLGEGPERWFTYQLTAVGESRKAAEHLCRTAHHLLWADNLPVNVTGGRVARRRLVRDYGSTREGTIYNAVARVRLLVVPA